MTLLRLLNCGTFLTNCGGAVSDKPVVFAKEEVRFGYVNGTVDLVCQVQAEPPPTFKWFKKIGKSGKARDFKGKVDNDSEEMHRSVAKVMLLLNIDATSVLFCVRNFKWLDCRKSRCK